MDYGTYSKDGGYSGWKTYNGKKRYFTFSEDHEYAYMKEGLNFINGVPMYFDNSGYLVTSEIEDETAIKKMGSYYYAVDCCGEVTIDDWEEIDDSFYYFDRKGRMLRNGKYKINGDYYLFDTDGIMYAGDLGIEFYDFKSNTYAVRTDGTLVSGKCGKIDGKEYYFDKTGRRITFEYSLVAGVNDQPDDIRELTAILKRRNCHLNLIPVNPIKERDFKKPDRKNALEFKNKLEKNGINVTIRREMGSDIDGACGQLRRRYVETEGE